MNSFDIVVAVILGFCLIRGIFRGLVKEMASIIGVLAGFYAAYTYYPEMAGLLSRWISNTVYLNIASFMVLFCLILIVISILGVVLKYLMSIALSGLGRPGERGWFWGFQGRLDCLGSAGYPDRISTQGVTACPGLAPGATYQHAFRKHGQNCFRRHAASL
jgi:hypothetical protein